MTRRRANPSRIPPRPAAEPPVVMDGTAPRLRTGHQMAHRWQKSLSGIPRWGRILIVSIMALAVTLMIFPQVDAIYLDYFFSPETLVLPAYISAGAGLLMYVVGWWLVVGSRARAPHEQVSNSPALLWYIGLGGVALVVCTLLLLHGLTLSDTVAGA